MITRDLRRALAGALAAAGFPPPRDLGLRSTGTPGQYAASVALTLGGDPPRTAQTLARALAREPWVAAADVTGPGYLTVTVAAAALAAVADAVTRAGEACVRSDALAGQTVPAAPLADPLTAGRWEAARAALAVRLTARLAAAAGATVAESPSAERLRSSPPPPTARARPATAAGHCPAAEVARAVAFAGRDAVTFTLARALPGKPLTVDQRIIARHVPSNPAYAVRYAHARAASGVRWAVASSSADTIGVAGASALLDALSWLPERVATAARRGRPDEFARYLEDLASVTVDVLSSVRLPGEDAAPGSDRLGLATAARTGLAAGLSLLEVSAPDRL